MLEADCLVSGRDHDHDSCERGMFREGQLTTAKIWLHLQHSPHCEHPGFPSALKSLGFPIYPIRLLAQAPFVFDFGQRLILTTIAVGAVIMGNCGWTRQANHWVDRSYNVQCRSDEQDPGNRDASRPAQALHAGRCNHGSGRSRCWCSEETATNS